MATDYTKAVRPDDPNAEYLTVQETAYVFRCSVKTIRRIRKELNLGSQVGVRIMLDRDERRAMFEARKSGPPTRIPKQRRRRQPVRKPPAAKAA